MQGASELDGPPAGLHARQSRSLGRGVVPRGAGGGGRSWVLAVAGEAERARGAVVAEGEPTSGNVGLVVAGHLGVSVAEVGVRTGAVHPAVTLRG